MRKVKTVLFSVLLSFVVTFILIAIAALIISKVGVLPEKLLPVILLLLCCVSVGIGGYCTSLIMKEKGAFYGGVVAAIFTAVLAGVSLCISTKALGVTALWNICAVLLSGAIGGILGVNRKEKVRF